MNKSELKSFNKLFRKQLHLYLCNPLFYIAAAIFTIFIYINFFIKQQFFTGSGTTDLILYFSSIPYISILIIPALCYKTSFTSYDNFLPFGRLAAIFSNFLYIFVSYLIMLILLIPGIFIVNACGDVDFGQVFTSILCLVFYGSALISLCLLLQNIFNSQIISFIFCSICLAVFNVSHLIPVYVNTGTFSSALFKQLSFAWHFDAASKGILDSRDLLFLIIISFCFLMTNFLVQEIKAGKKYNKKSVRNIIIQFLCIILLILNAGRWFIRLDFSKAKTYSLSKYTKQVINNADNPVKITYYRSKELTKLYPQIRDVSDFLVTYSSQNKNISLQIKDPEREDAAQMLESYGVYSQQLRNVKSNSTEFINVYSAIFVEYNGNAEVIPFVMSAQSLEYDLDGRFLHLVTGHERTVNIIVGNDLSLSQDYNYLVPYLTSQGFVCNPLFIQSSTFTDDLMNTQGTLLIIGDCNINITNAIAIENYLLQQKGNAFICVNPFVSKIEDDWSIQFAQRTNIVELIENLGITFENSIAADLSCARITMFSQENTTNTQILNYPLWISLQPQENCKTGATLFWPTPLLLSSEYAKPLIVSSPYAYSYEADKHNKTSVIETNPFVLNELSGTTQTLKKDTFVLGAEYKGPFNGLYNNSNCSSTNIYIIPDQYFLNSLMNEYIGGDYGDYRNFDFLVNALLKLNGEDELAAMQENMGNDKSLYKLSGGVEHHKLLNIIILTYLVIFIIIPAILILIFIFNKTKRFKAGKCEK